MSSFICANGVCTFTRVDTDGFTNVPYPTYNPYPYYTFSPAPVSSPIDDPAFNETFNVTNDKVPMEGDDSIPMEDDDSPIMEGDDRIPIMEVNNSKPINGSNASGGYYDPYGNGYYDEYGNFIPYYGGGFGNDTIAPWTDKANQDMLSATVAITRDFSGSIFNAFVEWDQHNDYSSPSGTEWAILPEGQTFEEARCSMHFCNWLDCFAHYDIKSYLNKPGIVHLIEEDEYYNIMFTNWTSSRDESPFYYNRRLEEQKKQGRRTQEGQKQHGHRTQEEGQKKQDRRTREGKKQGRRTQEEGQTKQDRRTQKGPMEERAQEIPSRTSDSGSATTQSHEDEYCGYSGCYNDDSYYGGGYDSLETLGGGFQYVRDQSPIVIDESLPDCPSCSQAKTSPEVLTGPVDDSFQEVSIAGVTPLDSDILITITAVGQDSSPRCNLEQSDGMAVRPNAKGVGESTVMLRRTRVPGQLNPFRYTVYFKASNEAGSCNGQATVCSPPEGWGCNDYIYGYDATATSFCDYY